MIAPRVCLPTRLISPLVPSPLSLRRNRVWSRSRGHSSKPSPFTDSFPHIFCFLSAALIHFLLRACPLGYWWFGAGRDESFDTRLTTLVAVAFLYFTLAAHRPCPPFPICSEKFLCSSIIFITWAYLSEHAYSFHTVDS